MQYLKLSALFVLLLVFAGGCSMQTLAVRSTAGIIDKAMESFNDEEDIYLARDAVAADLKLIEGLIASDPGNKKLLLTAAEAFGGVAFGFFELEMERYRDEDDEKFELYRKRAKIFYRRGMRYALESMLDDYPEFENTLKNGTLKELEAYVAEIDEEHIAGLFWVALCYGSVINNSRDDMTLVAALPKVKLLMEKVIAIDPSYFHGGPHLFFAIMNAGLPKTLGGNPVKGKEHFEKALELTDNKMLLANVLYARFYAVAVQDKELYMKELDKVLEAPDDTYPGNTLYTMLAKERAKILKARVDDFFLD